MRSDGKSPAVFFDRDGTLIEEVNYCDDPKKVLVYSGVCEALRRLKMAGFKNFIITNQAGIGRGYFTEQQYRAVECEVLHQIGDGLIEATYYCPNAPWDPSTRRKPDCGMVLEAVDAYDIDLARSFFVGDKASDIECGRKAGVRTILVTTGYGSAHIDCRPDFIAKDVVAGTEIILQTTDA